jgi:hypothetical protein
MTSSMSEATALGCLGLLVCCVAHSAEAPAPADAASSPNNAAAAAAEKKQGTQPKTRVVKFFVKVVDKEGKADSKADVRIQSGESSSLRVGAEGEKLTVLAAKASTVTLILPGARCQVTVEPSAAKEGSLALLVERQEDGVKCGVAPPPKK